MTAPSAQEYRDAADACAQCSHGRYEQPLGAMPFDVWADLLTHAATLHAALEATQAALAHNDRAFIDGKFREGMREAERSEPGRCPYDASSLAGQWWTRGFSSQHLAAEIATLHAALEEQRGRLRYLEEGAAAVEAEVVTLRTALEEREAEIAAAREACPSVRMQDNFDAPLLTLVNKEVWRGFNRDAEVERAWTEVNRLRRDLANSVDPDIALTRECEQLRAEVTTLREALRDMTDKRDQLIRLPPPDPDPLDELLNKVCAENAALREAQARLTEEIGLACNREFRRSSDSDAFVAEIRALIESHSGKISGAPEC